MIFFTASNVGTRRFPDFLVEPLSSRWFPAPPDQVTWHLACVQPRHPWQAHTALQATGTDSPGAQRQLSWVLAQVRRDAGVKGSRAASSAGQGAHCPWRPATEPWTPCCPQGEGAPVPAALQRGRAPGVVLTWHRTPRGLPWQTPSQEARAWGQFETRALRGDRAHVSPVH